MSSDVPWLREEICEAGAQQLGARARVYVCPGGWAWGWVQGGVRVGVGVRGRWVGWVGGCAGLGQAGRECNVM